MGNDVHEAIKIMEDMALVLDPSEDFLTVAAAEEHMNAVAVQREEELDKIQSELRSLAHILDAARMSSTRPRGALSAEEHATMLNDLDATKLSLAKRINDAEGLLSSKEAELARLKEELVALKASNPEQEHELDSATLRLAIYKGIGFQPVADKEGRVQKMLIRSQWDEVHCVSLEESRANGFYTDTLWSLVSS